MLAADRLKPVSDVHRGPVRSITAIAPLDEKTLRLEILRLFSRKDIRVGVAAIYPEQSDLIRAEGQGGTDCTYEGWLSSVETRGLFGGTIRCPRRAQAIKIDDSIVLITSDANCASKRVLLQGNSDPTEFNLLGTTFKVVDLAISVSGFQAQHLQTTLYVQTQGDVTILAARELLGHVRQRIPGTGISVVLRNDRWFIMDCQFPLLSSWIGQRKEVPTKQQFLSTPQAYCGFQGPWPIQCY